MKTSTIWIVLLLLCHAGAVTAQKEQHVWLFGRFAGVDFNSGSPVNITRHGAYAFEGCASIADSSGNLLFSVDGMNVYDNSHVIMPNAPGMLGNEGGSTTQGIAISPIRGKPHLYNVFTLGAYEVSYKENGYLRYNIVDMTLNSGYGDIVTGAKNIFIDSGMSEKMIVTGKCGQLWLITHHHSEPKFYAYAIGDSGSIAAPVVSVAGTVNRSNAYRLGEMKVSADGTRLALASFSLTPAPDYYYLEIYDFDPGTGKVSNYRMIDSANDYRPFYGVEFSPGGSKLYSGNFSAGVYQYDLSLFPSLPAVRASRTLIIDRSASGLRLGPDNMVYAVLQDSVTRLSRIRKPDAPGILCDFEADIPALYLSGMIGHTLGNRINIVRDSTFSARDTAICSALPVYYKADPGYSVYIWNDGDTSRNRYFSAAGTYWQYRYNCCAVHIDTFRITVNPEDTVLHVWDTILCPGVVFTIGSAAGYSHYTWHDGSTAASRTMDNPGLYWVTASKICHTRIDTFRVRSKADTIVTQNDTVICFSDTILLYPPPGYDRYLWDDGSVSYARIIDTSVAAATVHCTDIAACRIHTIRYLPEFIRFPLYIPDTSICEQDSFILDVYTPGGSYLWMDGSRNQTYQVKTSNNYWVEVTVSGCSRTDTGMITVRSIPGTISGDTSVCADQKLLLAVQPEGGTYLWQDGSTAGSFQVQQSGRYTVMITQNGCSVSRSADVVVNDCTSCIMFFNSFSPNDDGLNDQFKPVIRCPVKQYELLVYDRWGQELFRTANSSEAWDGTVRGSDAAGATYFYMIRVSFDIPGADSHLFKGDVTLLR